MLTKSDEYSSVTAPREEHRVLRWPGRLQSQDLEAAFLAATFEEDRHRVVMTATAGCLVYGLSTLLVLWAPPSRQLSWPATLFSGAVSVLGLGLAWRLRAVRTRPTLEAFTLAFSVLVVFAFFISTWAYSLGPYLDLLMQAALGLTIALLIPLSPTRSVLALAPLWLGAGVFMLTRHHLPAAEAGLLSLLLMVGLSLALMAHAAMRSSRRVMFVHLRTESETNQRLIELLKRVQAAERQARESETQLAAVFDTAPLPLGLMELPSGQWVRGNDGMRRLITSKAQGPLPGQARHLIDSPAERDAFIRRLQKYGTIELPAVPVPDADGRLRKVRIWAATIEIEGRPHAVVGAMDVTQSVEAAEQLRAAKEAAEQANHAKSRFLANMSHEIRTPMNGVLGMATLMSVTALNEEQQEYLSTIRSSGEDLLRIINDILDHSKIEAGRFDLEDRNFSIRRHLEEFAPPLRTRIAAKGLTWRMTVDDDVPDALRGDAGRIRQVLTNLVGNAIKFTQEGSVQLRVGLIEAHSERVKLGFEIKDTGIGFSDDVAEHLFEAFAQADSSTARKFGGTGLGLSISRSIALLMGGDITAEGRPGHGATFTLTAWLGQASTSRIISRVGMVPPAAPLDQPAWALLVEDNVVNQRVASKMLQRLNVVCDVRGDGVQALAAYQERQYDLILMDVQMPIMDGLEAARRVRALEAGTGRRVPIVAMTAHALAEDRARCLEAGMDDYISKPVDPVALEAAIKRWSRAS